MGRAEKAAGAKNPTQPSARDAWIIICWFCFLIWDFAVDREAAGEGKGPGGRGGAQKCKGWRDEDGQNDSLFGLSHLRVPAITHVLFLTH